MDGNNTDQESLTVADSGWEGRIKEQTWRNISVAGKRGKHMPVNCSLAHVSHCSNSFG